jgi:hypothetical protein
MGQAGALYRTGGPQSYPGQSFVGPTGGQISAWDQNLGYADQVFGGQNAPKFGQATGALSSLLTGGAPMGQLAGGYSPAAGTALGKMLSGKPDYSGLQGSIDAANAPILRQLNEDILPGLNQRAMFLNNGTGGIKTLNRVLPELGERMSLNAQTLTEGERQRALGAQAQGLGIYGQFAQGAQSGQMAGLGMFPTLAAAGQYPGQLAGQFADWGAGFQDRALQDQIGRFNYNQNLPWQNLQNYNGIVQGFGGMGGTSSQTQPGGSPLLGAAGGALTGLGAMGTLAGMTGGSVPALGALTGALGSGLGAAASWGGAGALLGLLSDRRAKEDITRVGTLDSGLSVYRYRYKGDRVYQIGVMADEARERFPEAVTQGADGLDRVDYARIH